MDDEALAAKCLALESCDVPCMEPCPVIADPAVAVPASDIEKALEWLDSEANPLIAGPANEWRSAQAKTVLAEVSRLRSQVERMTGEKIAILEALDPVVPWEARNHGEPIVERIEYVKAQLERLQADVLTPEEARAIRKDVEGESLSDFVYADWQSGCAKLRRLSSGDSE